ncbi:MAG: hypothetical protein IK116_07435 [Firmicutes bacterium]|nr:hypothetical protein [Bacillota bacterium]
MRAQSEIDSRLLEVEEALLDEVARRQRRDRPDAERDLYILSLLDQLETLLWVLEREQVVH